jgi:hypothetical protein
VSRRVLAGRVALTDESERRRVDRMVRERMNGDVMVGAAAGEEPVVMRIG